MSITLSMSSIEFCQKAVPGWPTAAFRTTTSMAPHCASTAVTQACTASASATLHGKGWTLPFVSGSAASASSKPFRLATAATTQPRDAKSRAITSPTPLEAPVTRITPTLTVGRSHSQATYRAISTLRHPKRNDAIFNPRHAMVSCSHRFHRWRIVRPGSPRRCRRQLWLEPR